MLRKGSSVTNIHGIGNNTPNNGTNTSTVGLSSSTSATSSPYHFHHHLRQRQHRSSSSGGGISSSRESLPQYQQHQHRSHYIRSTPSPSATTIPSGVLEEVPTPPKRGNSHSQSTGDIHSRSNNRSSPHLQTHQHCYGCACSPSKGLEPAGHLPLVTLSSSTANLSSSPRHSSPPHHQQTAQLFRDCPVDSHPRLATNPPPLNHSKITSGRGTPNNKLWLVGKKEEEDDEEGEGCYYYDEGEEDDEERRDTGITVPPVVRQRKRVNSNGGGVIGSVQGSTSHGYSHHRVLSPFPVVITGTVPCHHPQGGTSSPFNNAGAILTATTPVSPSAAALSSHSVVASPPELLLPMDFIQVLIHQHAKTIVALQDLQREVSTLKDFRTSLLHSLPATAPTAPASHVHGLSEAVWTTGAGGAVGGSSAPVATTATSSSSSGAGGVGAASSAPKIPHPDSGFSTETKSTNQKSDAESDDELYSLLSLIQCKVQESIIRNDYLLSSHQQSRSTAPGYPSSASRSRRRSDTSTKPKERLGKLDKVLGNCDKVEFKKDFISRDVIRGVLGAEKTELQRQLFFALVKIENLKSMTKESKTIDSRVHALSQENEQLRYKLKEMEIELEGTKATLRILQKNSYSPPALLQADKRSSSTTVLPEASSHQQSTTPTSHHLPYRSRMIGPPPVIPPTPQWETDSLDEATEDPLDYPIPGVTSPAVVTSPSPAVVASSSALHSSASTATRQRLIQKLSDIQSVSNFTSSKHTSANVSSSANNNSTIRLLPSNNYSSSSNNSSSHLHHNSSKKSPAPKPPVISEHATAPVSGSPPSSSGSNGNNNNNNTITPSGKKSASPVGNKSMSSIKSNNSSIPIAVSRLKAGKAGGAGGSAGSSPNNSNSTNNPNSNNNNNTNKTPSGKVKGGHDRGGSSGTGGNSENGGIGNIWYNWFKS